MHTYMYSQPGDERQPVQKQNKIFKKKKGEKMKKKNE